MDRPSLERLCDQALSAEEIAQPLLDQRTFHGRHEQMESDWIWICLSALWQRWFPDKPSFEALDDKMQAGYELRKSGAVAVCRVWLEAWSDVLRILDKAGMQSIQEFDDRFGGSQSLFNWIQDLEGELWNAGLEDRQFLTARIALCEEGLRRFRTDDDLMTENRRRALAESYYELGETGQSGGPLSWLAASGSALGLGMDRLVGLLPIHAHGTEAIGTGASRSCGKGFPSRMSGTVRTLPIGSPMPARSRDAARKRRSFGDRRNEAPKLSRCRGVSARLVKSYAKRPRSTSAAQVCRSARCRTWRPSMRGRLRRSHHQAKGRAGTSHALAGAARNSRNAAAPEWLASLVAGLTLTRHTRAYPSAPSELNLRKPGSQERENRGQLQYTEGRCGKCLDGEACRGLRSRG